jgi:hypothetical protein
MSKFGDIDVAKANAEMAARIKAVLTLLFQMFSGSRNNTANMIQNFIPHLKRTDRDYSSLPFFGKAYTTHKTNKEHILLTKISKIIQAYWDYVDAKIDMPIEEYAEFAAELKLIEQIAGHGLDTYHVHGEFPNFTLMSKAQIDLAEIEDAKVERAEAERTEEKEQQQVSDTAEAKKLMDEALGSEEPPVSTADTSTDAAETELGESSEEQLQDVVDSSDSSDDMAEESDNSSSDTDDDQLSTEKADACGGDCDTCETHACGAEEVSTEAATGETVDAEADRVKQQDNDGESYPDTEPLEQTIADAKDAIPPMPEEEKESQAAVDHETGDDSADDDGDSQEAVVA